MLYPKSLDRLIFELRKLPAVGNKMATRMAFNLISRTDDLPQNLARAISNAKQKLLLCEQCFGISEEPVCEICRSTGRDNSIITVIRFPQNMFHIEQTGSYKGLYHVLHGVISPLDGMMPEHLKIQPLLKRINEKNIQELIFALNMDLEGEATANYIHDLLKDRNINITRLGVGLPAGSDIEYIDPITITGALNSRTRL